MRLPLSFLSFSRFLCLSLVALFLAVLSSSPAHAQASNVVDIQTALKAVSSGAGAATVTASSTGATVASNVIPLVPANGVKVPVPVSVAANVSKGRIAAAALGCTNVVGAVVCAATAAATLKELKDAGLGYGPCPVGSMYTNAFICKPDPNYNPNQVDPASTGWKNQNGQYIGDLNSYSQSLYVQYNCNSGSGHINLTSSTTANVTCVNQYGAVGLASLTRETPYEPNVPMVVPSSSQIEADLQARMNADYEASRRLVEAMRADQAAAEAKGQTYSEDLKPVVASTPVTVNAPPVTGPETVIKTESKPLPDGSTDTTTTKQQSTVTPQVSGTTVGNTQIKFPSQTVITNTTVNNVTNNTSTSSSVVNNPSPQDKAPIDLPDDYAREDTLRKIQESLDTSSAKDMADQKPVVDAVEKKSSDDIGGLRTDAQGNQTADKGLWFSWVFDVPTASCSPFSGSVHGYAISWDLCPTIENIRAVLGWLMTVFSGLSVYGNLFRRDE